MKNEKVIYNFIGIVLLIFSEFYSSNIIYFMFLLLAVKTIYTEGIRQNSIWKIAVYSIMLPDNYICIFFAGVAGVYTLCKGKKYVCFSRRIGLLCSILIFWLLLSSIINAVSIVNIVFSILFFSTILIAMLLINSPRLYEVCCDIETAVEQVLSIEIAAVLVIFVHCILRGKFGDDWAIGTFGGAQQAQMFLIAFVGVILNYAKIKNNHGKRNYIKLILLICLVLATNCWSQLVCGIIAIALGWALSLDRKMLFKILLGCICFICLTPTFLKIIPNKISNQIISIVTDEEYRNYRFPKLEIYKNTYIDIPQGDIKFALLGNGMGNYASRAALTCTGYYVKSYSDFFEPSMSDYTEEYIFPTLLRAYYNSATDYGSVLARPYSSFIALMGEMGLVGVIVSMLIIIEIYKRLDKYGKSILLLWLSSCVLECYFEYTKVITFVLIGIGICKIWSREQKEHYEIRV